jgi:O-antigen/teichoic acid export membrane protein
LGARAVTDYTVPVQLAGRTSILAAALMTALFPRLSSATLEERRALTKSATLTLISLLGTPFVVGIYIMGPFLQIWVGELLGDHSAWVGRVILIGMWANALALISYTQLQASGRPDLVCKIMLLEILPYFGLLYVSVKLFGVPGCAIANAARSLLDYALLTWFAERRFTGWPMVVANVAVLSAAASFAGLWAPDDWRWWASGAALCGISLTLGALVIPPGVKAQVRERIRGLLPAR